MTATMPEGKSIKRIGIVYNPAKNVKAFEKAITALKQEGFALKIVATKNFDDVTVQVETLSKDNTIDLLLIGGGDGTLLAGINGLSSFDIPVGILPLGCSNDFSHALGIHSIDDAIAAIVKCNIKQVDLGIARYCGPENPAKTVYFCSTAGIGFIAAILKIENRPAVAYMKKLVKDAIWPALAFYQALFSRHFSVQVCVGDKEVYGGKTKLLEVSKVKKAGGVLFTPDAELVNDNLDFWFARKMNIAKFFYSIIVRVASTNFKQLEQITYFSSGAMSSQNNEPVKQIKVRADKDMHLHLNGEYLGTCTEVCFDICNTNKLNVLHNV